MKQHGENGRFDAWTHNLETTLDSSGKMSSLVTASCKVRCSGIDIENLYMEYAVATMPQHIPKEC